MARSRPGARRSTAAPSSVDSSTQPPSLASATLARVWQGVGYRPLPDAGTARPLLDFAAIPWPEGRAPAPEGRATAPEGTTLELAWGAHARDEATPGERLVGALVGERASAAMMFHGPVVVAADDPLEVAAQLVGAALDHAVALGVETVFTRPHGLDRVWVRFGFIPVPEGALPDRLAGRPGAGLYAWRGGTALWTFRESAAARA